MIVANFTFDEMEHDPFVMGVGAFLFILRKLNNTHTNKKKCFR